VFQAVFKGFRLFPAVLPAHRLPLLRVFVPLIRGVSVGLSPNREIVSDLQHGRRSGVVRLVDRYQRRLVGEAVTVFHVPQEDAEELVDDVLLSIVQEIGGFAFRRGDGDFHAWVMTVFRNRVRDFMRRAAILGDIHLLYDEAEMMDDDTCSETGHEVLREIVRSYREEALRCHEEEGEAGDRARTAALEVVREALEGLQSWERVLLRCRALGVPYEEIAEYTGKKPENLRVYHERTRRKFMGLVQAKLQGVV
jgi:RNA polymerase sigma factor (sigma-70 family)